MAIATGGVVPDGADAVVPIEDVEEQTAPSSFSARCARARTSGSARRRPRAPANPVVAAGVRLGAGSARGARRRRA